MGIAKGAGTLVGVAGLYFLLAGEVSGSEAMACLPVIALWVIHAATLARTRPVPMRIGWRGVGALAHSLLGLLPEMLRVGTALARAVGRDRDGAGSAALHVPFRFGALTAEDIGRRAAVTTALSLAPNGIVLGMDDWADTLIVHQLVPQPVGGDREWPA